jgi:hypothetical protein
MDTFWTSRDVRLESGMRIKSEVRMTDKRASAMRTSELPHYTPPG